MGTSIRNQLGEVRRKRGVAAAELARRVGVSRQTIHAIETGAYVPNTEVSLKLARELEVSVEELFSIGEERAAGSKPVHSKLLSATGPMPGQAVQLCRVGERLVSVPVSAAPYFLPDADGVILKRWRGAGGADVVALEEEKSAERLAIAGCDPAIGVLVSLVKRLADVEILPAAASSHLALDWLKERSVHIAGMHLKDSKSGEFNVPIVRREFPNDDFALVTFARWEEGFVTAAGNPHGIRKAADLSKRGMRFVNREKGSGSRALIDSLLKESGVKAAAVAGYERVARGHLAAAYAVRAGEADCCIATGSAARAFGLDFVPLQAERYDFVLRRSDLGLPAVVRFMDVLQRASLRRRLEALAGYETGQTGALIG